jgi:hypothetical protein
MDAKDELVDVRFSECNGVYHVELDTPRDTLTCSFPSLRHIRLWSLALSGLIKKLENHD